MLRTFFSHLFRALLLHIFIALIHIFLYQVASRSCFFNLHLSGGYVFALIACLARNCSLYISALACVARKGSVARCRACSSLL